MTDGNPGSVTRTLEPITLQELIDMFNLNLNINQSMTYLGDAELKSLENSVSRMPDVRSSVSPCVYFEYNPCNNWALTYLKYYENETQFASYIEWLDSWVRAFLWLTHESYCIYRISERVSFNQRRCVPFTLLGCEKSLNIRANEEVERCMLTLAPLTETENRGVFDMTRRFLPPSVAPSFKFGQDFYTARPSGLLQWLTKFANLKRLRSDFGARLTSITEGTSYAMSERQRHDAYPITYESSLASMYSQFYTVRSLLFLLLPIRVLIHLRWLKPWE